MSINSDKNYGGVFDSQNRDVNQPDQQEIENEEEEEVNVDMLNDE